MSSPYWHYWSESSIEYNHMSWVYLKFTIIFSHLFINPTDKLLSSTIWNCHFFCQEWMNRNHFLWFSLIFVSTYMPYCLVLGVNLWIKHASYLQTWSSESIPASLTVQLSFSLHTSLPISALSPETLWSILTSKYTGHSQFPRTSFSFLTLQILLKRRPSASPSSL